MHENVAINQEKQEIACNILDQSNHIYNQNHLEKQSQVRKLWELLLDNQLICDIIMNRKLLKNIRKCRWILSLQTQLGEYIFNEVGELMGVETM